MPDNHPKIKQTVFHNDDIKFTLEFPSDISKFTDLNESDLLGEVEIFARILFQNIATKTQNRNFQIIKNEETGLYEYFIKSSAD